MSYRYLGQNLFETADAAKKYFAKTYGAKSFACEEPLNGDLPLRPTWTANLPDGCRLCIDVRETPFSPSLADFVGKCAARGMPVRLWVVIPGGSAGPNFNSELKQAHELGIGVVEIGDGGNVAEYYRALALSLFGLKKSDLRKVPASKRQEVKTSEELFLDGSPEQGCQEISQLLEALTRTFAEHGYSTGWWRLPTGTTFSTKFFRTNSWAILLEKMETHLDIKLVRVKCKDFSKNLIVQARSHAPTRNTVSHKPKTLRERQARDAKLRTIFENTRDTLLEWYAAVKPLRLV